nr:calcineurin-like phosphoesterase C-terminal domain-containing protein [uncultured Desulfobacter sp.]
MKKGAIALSVGLLLGALTNQAAAADTVTGKVFWDRNQNGIQETWERGIPKVCVSNGKEVTQTNSKGIYELPAYDDMVVFVVKPSGWMTPVDENNLPQFSYVHKPEGSPDEIQRFRGLDPTGLLPNMVNFPLYRVGKESKFKAIITGDTQVYNDREINFLRDSLVKEVQGTKARFCISMGDNVGDDLSLYPRYLEVMGKMGIPVYYVPGNHDLDFDATRDEDSFDTMKSYMGATYYSFNYGDVHFVILDSVEYPSAGSSSYNGKISDAEMEWLANDLAYVPMDKLIVLNMHIPIVSDLDRTSDRHQVDNREDLYALLDGRKVVSLGGHTHTLSHFKAGDELDGWGQQTPFDQIIVGAACGSWWSGDLDDTGVPVSYMRDGVPRGHMVFAFSGNDYEDVYKAGAKAYDKQIHMAFLTDEFQSWYDSRAAGEDVTINDLENRNIISSDQLSTTKLVANVWSANKEDKVVCVFDKNRRTTVTAQYSEDIMDPYALPLEMYVLRGVPGFALFDKNWDNGAFTGTQYGPGQAVDLGDWLHTTPGRSTHLFQCSVPTDLEVGPHSVEVLTRNASGKVFREKLVFEVE